MRNKYFFFLFFSIFFSSLVFVSATSYIPFLGNSTYLMSSVGTESTNFVLSYVNNSYVQFNGLTNYVNISDNNAYSKNTTSEISMCFWFKSISCDWQGIQTGGYTNFFAKLGSNANEWTFRTYNCTGFDSVSRAQRLSFYQFNASGGLGIGSYFQDDLVSNGWVYVCGLANQTSTRIYKNAILRDTDTFAPTLAPTNTPSAVTIGAQQNNGVTNFGNMIIDDVRIFNITPDQSELNYLYARSRDGKNNDSGILYFNNSQTNALRNGTSVVFQILSLHQSLNSPSSVILLNDSYIKFTGSSDYINVPRIENYNTNKTGISISFWVNRSSGGLTSNEGIVTKYEIANNNREWFAQINSSGYPSIIYGDNGTNTNSFTATKNIADDTWHSVVFTYNLSLVSIYVDGVLNFTQNYGLGIFNGTAGIRLGNAITGTQYTGALSSVRIYNSTLNSSEVTSINANARLINKNVLGTSSDNNQILYMPLKENGGSSIIDVSSLANDGSVVGSPSYGNNGVVLSLTNGTDYIANATAVKLINSAHQYKGLIINYSVVSSLWSSQVLYMPFDEGSGSLIKNYGSAGNNGTLIGGTWQNDGVNITLSSGNYTYSSSTKLLTVLNSFYFLRSLIFSYDPSFLGTSGAQTPHNVSLNNTGYFADQQPFSLTKWAELNPVLFILIIFGVAMVINLLGGRRR